MTLARAFAAELESGATEFHTFVGNFILCAILGKKPMLGDPIKNEQVRMTAAIFVVAISETGAPIASRMRQNIGAALVGNLLEWYDFAV
jgi:hypothetical protein